MVARLVSEHLGELASLDLSGNSLEPAGKKALASMLRPPDAQGRGCTLTELSLELGKPWRQVRTAAACWRCCCWCGWCWLVLAAGCWLRLLALLLAVAGRCGCCCWLRLLTAGSTGIADLVVRC